VSQPPSNDSPAGPCLEPADYLPGSWPGGSTRAIYADPPTALAAPAAARLWAGTATIERPAAYSYFPGRVRIHIPIRGNGLRLRFEAPDELVELASLDQHRFDGARPVRVELVNGPVEAFNLIVRADAVARAEVLRLELDDIVALASPSDSMPAAAVRLVYVVSGAVTVGPPGQTALQLGPDATFVVDPRTAPLDSPLELRGRAPGTLVILAALHAGAGT
jgi:environmental stress-induced protein Ves